jgi:AP-1 complex subunit gamma-1
MSNLKLREVIKQIRQCKTAAEERAVISKESALIRNAFKVRWEAWVHEKRIVIGRQ